MRKASWMIWFLGDSPHGHMVGICVDPPKRLAQAPRSDLKVDLGRGHGNPDTCACTFIWYMCTYIYICLFIFVLLYIIHIVSCIHIDSYYTSASSFLYMLVEELHDLPPRRWCSQLMLETTDQLTWLDLPMLFGWDPNIPLECMLSMIYVIIELYHIVYISMIYVIPCYPQISTSTSHWYPFLPSIGFAPRPCESLRDHRCWWFWP